MKLSWSYLFIIALTCLVGHTGQARVSPLRDQPPALVADGRFGAEAVLEEWVKQSPLPTGANLNGVAWATATHGFAAGTGLTLVETFDGGVIWRDVNLAGFDENPFYNVYCSDANTCFVIGNSATTGLDHWRTSNAGATWQKITVFPLGGSWYHIDFVSPTVGFMGSNGATVRSTDSGVTWQVMSGYPSCPVMYGMDFRDTQVGLCGGDRVSTTDGGPGIFKTTDAGVTWVRKFSQSANDVLWLNDTTAIATVGVSIYRSTNSGDTWSQINSQIFTGLDEMVNLPNGTIVAVSLAGDAWRSTDGGVNWTRTLEGVGSLPASWNVDFFDDQIGMIVGQSGYIFKTTDGGLTWTMLNSGIGGVEFNDIKMFDDQTGLVVGQNGYFLRTENGGNFWKTDRLKVTGLTLFRDEGLAAVDVVDANFAVTAGNNGVVYKSFDRGVNWQSIGYPLLPDDYLISGVKFTTHDIGYVAGTRPQVAIDTYRTTNGGASWTSLGMPAHYVDFVDVNHGWLLTIGGTGFRTTNGGTTWTPMTLPNSGSSPIISRMEFASQNVGWAVGWFGYAAKTSNGGATWQLQNVSSADEILLGISVLSETEAYVVGVHTQPTTETASLYHTVNGGTNWTRSFLPADFLNNVFASPTGNIWTSGYAGTVLHMGAGQGMFQLASAVSRQSHRTAGNFDINLPLTGEPGVECRSTKGKYSLVFNFTSNVISGSASVTSGTGTAGTPVFSGTTMTVPLSGVADVQKLTVTLTGVTDVSSQVLPSTPVSLNVLIGDTNGDKSVDTTDVTLTRGQVGMAVTGSNFRDDVRVDGTITSADVKQVRTAVGHSLP
ncbi:MAG: YCF48-related protein [Verrucomicrobiota bacterium]|nr:YCF48-related protein [Verrucomicrobiota bacterium]